MVQGGVTLIKYLLFLFNFVFWLSGIGIIVAGAVIQIRYSNYINILGNSFLSAPILLIVVGCIISLIGFFGCCGSIRENYCMTMTFAVLLGIVFILEFAAGIASYVMRNDLHGVLKLHAKEGMQNYNQSDAVGVTNAWNLLQQDFKCCGIEGFRDWNTSKVFADNENVPESCCRKKETKCADNVRSLPQTQTRIRIYEDGCLPKLQNWVKDNTAIVGGLGTGLAFIQILGIVFACCLSKSILKEYDDYYY